MLAVNEEGTPEGYALLSKRGEWYEAFEVAANTWPAIKTFCITRILCMEEIVRCNLNYTGLFH